MCNREVVVKALGFLTFLLPYVRKNLLLAGYVGNGFCKQTFGITTVTVPLFYFLEYPGVLDWFPLKDRTSVAV